MSKICSVAAHLDDLDDHEERHGEGGEDEEDGAEGEHLGEQAGTLVTGWERGEESKTKTIHL